MMELLKTCDWMRADKRETMIRIRTSVTIDNGMREGDQTNSPTRIPVALVTGSEHAYAKVGKTATADVNVKTTRHEINKQKEVPHD